MKTGTRQALLCWASGAIAASINLTIDWKAPMTQLQKFSVVYCCIVAPVICLVVGILLVGRTVK